MKKIRIFFKRKRKWKEIGRPPLSPTGRDWKISKISFLRIFFEPYTTINVILYIVSFHVLSITI